MMDWVSEENGGTLLRTPVGVKIEAPLPEMGQSVFLLFHEGRVVSGYRENAYEKGCGWFWKTSAGDFVAGYPLIIVWQPVVG